MMGYGHKAYAESLAEFGRPLFLPKSGGWILVRDIPETPYQDAMGCYPLFACEDWSALADDLSHLKEDLVCISLVTDPFGQYDQALLERTFPTKVQVFKEHFIACPRDPVIESIPSRHRSRARKGLKNLNVQEVANPPESLKTWCSLYSNLIERHSIRGLARFSERVFQTQLEVPGIHVFTATTGDETVGMVLWYCHDEVAYYHLAANSERGYELEASSALLLRSFEMMAARGVRKVTLGAGAGIAEQPGVCVDGLTLFKRGWSSHTQPVYFCARILNDHVYAKLSRHTRTQESEFFPNYRTGEYK